MQLYNVERMEAGAKHPHLHNFLFVQNIRVPAFVTEGHIVFGKLLRLRLCSFSLSPALTHTHIYTHTGRQR